MFLKTTRRFLSVNLLLLMLSLFLAAPSVLAQKRDWESQRTWVFVVGTLRWKHAEMFDSFPQESRRDADLVAFFRQQGVPSAQINRR